MYAFSRRCHLAYCESADSCQGADTQSRSITLHQRQLIPHLSHVMDTQAAAKSVSPPPQPYEAFRYAGVRCIDNAPMHPIEVYSPNNVWKDIEEFQPYDNDVTVS